MQVGDLIKGNLECVYGCCAERLYAAVYRKQSEGEWIPAASYNDGILNTAYCSVCKTYQPVGHWDYTPYCPYCGAKMKGGEE